jgi:hypothetical protein
LVYIESNGGILSNGSNTYDKTVNQVAMVACHPIKSVDQVRLNGKAIPLGPGGTGAQSTEWTYTPSSNQGYVNISSISRTGGLVTIHLVSPLPGQNGSQLQISGVSDRSFNGTFTVTQPNPSDATTFTCLNGGPDATSSGGHVNTTLPDWKNRVHVDRTSCLGAHTATFPELLSTSVLWTSAHKNLGRASVYIAHYFDQAVYSNGLPTTSFVISGKNDIYDPRTDTHGYTTNAALIIADYLTQPVWGFGLSYGTDIPLDQLKAAANICDEQIPLAAGGTEARYAINMTFDLSQTRGAVLQDMLNACAGRISIVSGQFLIQPGAWVGPSLSLNQSHLIGAIEYKPYLSQRDACNGVKGSFCSPVNNWESGDFPAYCEDSNHGYASDQWLAADNGVRVWKDVSLRATTSPATAQRLAKIELERIRREGRLTLHCNMSAYPAVAGDVIEFSYSRYGWVNKAWEVLSSKLIMQPDVNGEPPSLGVDLELAETDSSVYDWSSSEELAQSDTPSPAIDNGQSVTAPETLALESGPSTSYVGADGIALPTILASWQTSDPLIAYTDIQYQKVGESVWNMGGRVPGTQTECYIYGVVAGQQYNIQAQSYRANGVYSGWAQAGPITVSATSTSIVASNVKYSDGTPVDDLKPSQAGADDSSQNPLVYAGISESIVPNGSFTMGSLKGWHNGGNFTYGTDPNYGPIAYRAPSYGGDGGLFSPSFSIIPGRKYHLTYRVYNGSGDGGIYLRLAWQATQADNVFPVNGTTGTSVPGYIDVFAGSIPNNPTDYTYEFTAPAGAYFASMMVYNIGSSDLALSYLSCVPYGATGQYGADVTGSNTANNTSNVGDLIVSGGLHGSSGSAIDSDGNIILKNIVTVQGIGGTLSSTFSTLPSLGALTYSFKGNPVLVSLNLAFQATTSGGTVTGIGFNPTNATSTGGNPPTVSITISGDGSGASASVTWAGSGGPTVTFTPTVHINGGAGYSYANAIVSVYVPPGTSYSGPGSGTYTCSVPTPVPQAGVSISTQVLMDGNILFDPTQIVTDSNGRAKFNEMQVFSIPAGTHTFAVQTKYDNATPAKFINGLFNVVELG